MSRTLKLSVGVDMHFNRSVNEMFFSKLKGTYDRMRKNKKTSLQLETQFSRVKNEKKINALGRI